MIPWMLAAAALAQSGNPWSEVIEGEATEMPAPRRGDDAPPLEGLRVGPVRASTGVAVELASVVGGDGGTNAFTARTRLAVDDGWWVGADLPFVAYRTYDQRDTGLGNLQLSAFRELDDASALGVELTLPVGRAWTWVNEGEEIWPSGGVDVVYQLQREVSGATLLGRGAAGVHGSSGYAPFPRAWVKLEAAGAVDVDLSAKAGVVAEAALAWWDVAPLELSGLVRLAPVDGLDLRGGLVLPLFSWAGLQPAEVPAGVREATLVLQVRTTL